MPKERKAHSGKRLRQIPPVGELVEKSEAAGLVNQFGRPRVLGVVRDTLAGLRQRIRKTDGEVTAAELEAPEILRSVRRKLEASGGPGLCRVINATGILLHTGLGRAVLPRAALEAIASEQKGYSLLEIDRRTGERGYREHFVSELVCALTGAESATVVNNNAAATMLCLAAIAAGKEVIVSRGQLVEIGGAFRMPEVMAASGARLVEVGTTNRTYLADYERAITPETAMFMRVHASNFRIVGFTHSVPLEELVELGKKTRLPVLDDLGSGALLDFSAYGLTDEPMVSHSIRAGADLVCFSGDKLLGGPQAGIILGGKELVHRVRRHPLFRALRPDKLTLTALEATLRLLENPDKLAETHPVLRMVAMSEEELEKRAAELVMGIRKAGGFHAEVVAETAQLGGGSMPGRDLRSRAVAVTHPKISSHELSGLLVDHSPPIFARIKDDRLLLDLRTIQPGEEAEVAAAFESIQR